MFFLTLLLSFLYSSLPAQENFQFAEGIYCSFDDVIQKKPVSLSRIVSPDPFNYSEVSETKQIEYINDFGIKSTVSTNNIWGYVDKGTLYVQVNKEFHRVTMVGTISHLFVNEKYSQQTNYDPYYYGYGYPMSSPTYESNRLVQYLIDFKTGNILPMDLSSVETLLSADSEIFTEFMNLKKHKRKQMMLMYIRRFNEKYPLTFNQTK